MEKNVAILMADLSGYSALTLRNALNYINKTEDLAKQSKR